jgi:hypothetical protein
MSKRFGTLTVWMASEHGGYGYISDARGDKFFLHRRFIQSGNPTPGSSVIFEVLPAAPNAKYPRAVNATINANTPGARGTKIQPRAPVACTSTTVNVSGETECQK